MREIKFRGYSKESQKWVYGSLFNGFDWADFIIENTGFEFYHRVRVIPETVGQYTGLKDKTGKEIYEGDIVQHDAWDYPFSIIFNDERARFVCKMKTGLTHHIDNLCLTVIGNIHENPELL